MDSIVRMIVAVPGEQLRLVGCLLAAYPLAWAYSWTARSAGHNVRHLSMAAPGLIFGLVCYGVVGVAHCALVVAYTYGFLQLLRRLEKRQLREEQVQQLREEKAQVLREEQARSKDHARKETSPQSTLRWVPVTASMLVLAHLSALHIHRLVANPANIIDVTGSMMVLTIKVWTLIWDAWDECVHRRNAVAAKTGLVVCEESKHHAFGSPGIIELIGYVFWFPGFLVGPAIALRDYRRLSCVRDGRLSVVIVPALRRFALAWALVALNLLGPSRLPHEVGDLFNGLSPMVWWPCMLVYCYLLNQCFKAKFYYVWLMSEGAALAMGNSEVALVVEGDKSSASTSAHGHQGREQAHEHSNVMSNVDIWQVETAPTMQVIMRHWNTKTHHWLKHYVYVRVMQMSSSERASPRLRLAASFATYGCSALWHGFYGGYYLTFMTAALITALETSLQKAGLESLVDKLRIPRVFQYMASVVFAQLLLSYTVIPFMALDWQRSIEGWRAVGFWAHWYWLVAIVVLKVAASSIRKEEKKMKSK